MSGPPPLSPPSIRSPVAAPTRTTVDTARTAADSAVPTPRPLPNGASSVFTQHRDPRDDLAIALPPSARVARTPRNPGPVAARFETSAPDETAAMLEALKDIQATLARKDAEQRKAAAMIKEMAAAQTVMATKLDAQTAAVEDLKRELQSHVRDSRRADRSASAGAALQADPSLGVRRRSTTAPPGAAPSHAASVVEGGGGGGGAAPQFSALQPRSTLAQRFLAAARRTKAMEERQRQQVVATLTAEPAPRNSGGPAAGSRGEEPGALVPSASHASHGSHVAVPPLNLGGRGGQARPGSQGRGSREGSPNNAGPSPLSKPAASGWGKFRTALAAQPPGSARDAPQPPPPPQQSQPGFAPSPHITSPNRPPLAPPSVTGAPAGGTGAAARRPFRGGFLGVVAAARAAAAAAKREGSGTPRRTPGGTPRRPAGMPMFQRRASAAASAGGGASPRLSVRRQSGVHVNGAAEAAALGGVDPAVASMVLLDSIPAATAQQPTAAVSFVDDTAAAAASDGGASSTTTATSNASGSGDDAEGSVIDPMRTLRRAQRRVSSAMGSGRRSGRTVSLAGQKAEPLPWPFSIRSDVDPLGDSHPVMIAADVCYAFITLTTCIGASASWSDSYGFCCDAPVWRVYGMYYPGFAVAQILSWLWIVSRLFLQTRVGDWEVLDDTVRCRWAYLRSWFIFDMIIGGVPLDWAFAGWQHQAFFALQLRHFLRFPRMVTITRSNNPLLSSRTWYRIVAFFVFLAVAMHLCTLAFVAIEGKLYNEALYWSIVTVTSVGYGDIVPGNSIGQRLYASLVCVLGVLAVAFTTAVATSLLTTKDKLTATMDEKKQLMHSMLEYYTIPWNVQRDVIAMFPTVLETQSTEDFRAMVESMPRSIGSQVDGFTRAKLLQSVPMFDRLAGSAAMVAIGVKMRQRFVGQHDPIVAHGETGREMYFLVRGVAEVLVLTNDDRNEAFRDVEFGAETLAAQGFVDGDEDTNEDFTVIATLRAGQYFGERALIESTVRSATVQAVTLCELLILDHDDFVEVTEEYEELRHLFRKEFNSKSRSVEEHLRDTFRTRLDASLANIRAAEAQAREHNEQLAAQRAEEEAAAAAAAAEAAAVFASEMAAQQHAGFDDPSGEGYYPDHAAYVFPAGSQRRSSAVSFDHGRYSARGDGHDGHDSFGAGTTAVAVPLETQLSNGVCFDDGGDHHEEGEDNNDEQEAAEWNTLLADMDKVAAPPPLATTTCAPVAATDDGGDNPNGGVAATTPGRRGSSGSLQFVLDGGGTTPQIAEPVGLPTVPPLALPPRAPKKAKATPRSARSGKETPASQRRKATPTASAASDRQQWSETTPASDREPF